jgi:ligand-binding sensor domain-containing protein
MIVINKKMVLKHLNSIKPKYTSRFDVQIIAIIFRLIVGSPLLAQQQYAHISFDHLTSKDGLSQNVVTAILKDSEGFMWFGTENGLNRYDGYDFTVYHYQPNDTSSISENRIKCIFEDSRGNLWIGTYSIGLNLFDREKEAFIRYTNDPENEHSISNNFIRTIFEDCFGRLKFV